MEMDTQVNRYLRRVRQWLPCSRKMKNRIMEDIRLNLNAFLAEHPETDPSKLEEQFGSPRQIAAMFVENMGTAELLSQLRIRRKFLVTAGCILLTALLVWAIGVECVVIKALKNYPGTVVVDMWEEPTTLPQSK